MRATLISMLAVAALSVGICVFSLGKIERAANEIDGMRTEVLDMIEAGETERAHLRLQQMAEAWRGHEKTLAAIAPHDALHRITELIIEGSANLEAGDPDDFNRSMALLGEAIRHLHEEERLHFSNLLQLC